METLPERLPPGRGLDSRCKATNQNKTPARPRSVSNDPCLGARAETPSWVEKLPERLLPGRSLDPRRKVMYPTHPNSSRGKSSKPAARVRSQFLIIATAVTVEMVEARSCLVEASVASNLASGSLS